MNDNKKTITICSFIALIVLAVVIVITLLNKLYGFSIILGALFIVLTIFLGIYLRETPDEYTTYIKNKRRILRTYNSIIVEVESIPNIAGKNIIKVKTIEDLVDAQLELREPIYYKNDNDSCFFILLHYNEACIYILRLNDDVISPTEQSIRYMKEEPDSKKESLLENVENTIVYKLDELRSFKISPIRNQEKIDIKDDSAIIQSIEESKENKVTKENLEDEMSKTQYIKDLKERVKEYEATHKVEKEEPKVEDIPLQEIKEEKNISDILEQKKEEQPKKKVVRKKPVPKKVTHQTKRTTKYASRTKKNTK
mgnify:CR=1 FL=1